MLLEEIIEKKAYILCPEEWQRDFIVEYAKSLGDTGWENSEYHQYGEKTWFGVDARQCGPWFHYGSYSDLYTNPFISFDEFFIDNIATDVDVDEFYALLIGE